MSLKRIFASLIISIGLSASTYGQQQILNTQYVFNRHLINPAYTGVGNTLKASLLFRNQWKGIEGAPNTQAFSLHSPINYDNSFSLGGIIIRDKIGVTTQTGVYMTASYALQVSDETFISFGLQGGALTDRTNFSELDGYANDPSLIAEDRTYVRPNFGAGIYIFDDRFHIGLSVPNLANQKFEQFSTQEGSDINRFFYLDDGYVFFLNPQWTLDLSTLLKVQPGDPVQFDINALVGVRQSIWFGTSYRSFESFDLLFRLKIARDYYFSYSYDIATGPVALSRVNTGSHEFNLQFGLSEISKKINRRNAFRR
ncbi:type IX secretion system membrane protein PorP/SprF [uncultured Roseivirga sp.]|uniref:PorP/SprF family type IX secretion system membrane protein n=2 Tax=uncultured Roseivirga sp. TaxID=543088 RepID=UPI0030D989EC|tara:strand:+ start:1422 stop:2357 length:936 start_codon:yes stop_codon:yes gene_type:complete